MSNPAPLLRVIPPALCLLLLAGCRPTNAPSTPSQIREFPDDLKTPGLEQSGIYDDGWVGNSASIVLSQPEGRKGILVKGMVPKIDREDFRTELQVIVNKKEVARKFLPLGEFSVAGPLLPGAGRRRIELVFTGLQKLPNDGRKVGARLSFLGFDTYAVPPDIFSANKGLQLGRGWGVLETFDRETFRWVDNDADISFPGRGGSQKLNVRVQPGPGLAGKPLVLKVFDGAGRQVGAVEVRGRKTIQLTLPSEAGKENVFRLHADGGGKKTPADPRILNFRIFFIELE